MTMTSNPISSNKGFWLAIAVVTGGLIYLLSPVLMPFLVAALLGYIGDPLVDRIEKWKLSRTVAVTIVFISLSLLALSFLLILIPLLHRQILLFAGKLPGYIDTLQTTVLPWLQTQFGLDQNMIDIQSIKQSLQEHVRQAGGILMSMLGSVTQSGLAVLGTLANLVLIPVVAFYLLRDWDHLVARVHELIPRHIEPVVVKLSKQSDEILGAFLRGQLLVMLSLGVVYTIGLWIAGIQYAVLIGMIAGIVSFVPYLGLIIGLSLAAIAAVFQYHDVSHLVYVAIVFGVGQALESVVLTPMLVGDRIGLHPVAVIFAVLAFGQLFGFVGVLLALPIAAVTAVVLRYMHEQYLQSELYSDNPSGMDDGG
jgi:predicted PurR-regulated permease PerM